MLRRAAFTITDAQIKSSPTASQIIVPAPGANFVNRLHAITLQLSFTAGYTGISATQGYMVVTHGDDGDWLCPALINDTTPTPDITLFSDYFGAAGDHVITLAGDQSETIPLSLGSASDVWVAPFPPGSVSDLATMKNLALYLSIKNNSVNFGGGNAANKIRGYVYYTVEGWD